MIVGNVSLLELDRIYRDARINEPFIYVYRNRVDGMPNGLLTGYFEVRDGFGLTCVVQNVIVTKNALDREVVKREMPIYAMRAAFSRPCDTIITCVELQHPLYAMLCEWTTKTLGGEWYADDNDSSWFYIRKESFNGKE